LNFAEKFSDKRGIGIHENSRPLTKSKAWIWIGSGLRPMMFDLTSDVT
jgi:hypothetical protein